MSRLRNKILFFLLLSAMIISCTKEEEDEAVFETSYDGLLEVTFSNSYPVWSVNTSMTVGITAGGAVTIEPGSLSYTGETLVTDDSKITRSGRWDMSPVGSIKNSRGLTLVVIDPQITVNNDVTRVYAKTKQGTWELVSQAPWSGNITSELSFRFDQATTDPIGSVVQVSEATGAIVWTLSLIPMTPLEPYD